MVDVIVTGKKISEMDLVTNITGNEKIPTDVVGDRAVSTGQILQYVNEEVTPSWGNIKGDITLQTDINSLTVGVKQALQQHIEDQDNPHKVTKAQVGLGNVDNTSDLQKPISTSVQSALDSKANKDEVVTSVIGQNGDITKEVILDSLALGNTAFYDYEDLPESNYQKGLNNNLTFPYRLLNVNLGRTLNSKLSETVSVKDLGAIADGTLHKLQEWVTSGRFADLAAIKTVFPFVTSLDQSIDWCATQYAVKNYTNVYMPQGSYVFSDVVQTNHATTPYTVGSSSKGLRIHGDGSRTMITRQDARAATRIINLEGTSTTRESDVANMKEACFSIHSPYTTISDMVFTDSAVGVYLGQDYNQLDTSLSNVSKSNLQRLEFDRVGTGILYLAHGGNHYTNVSDIHFHRCQIDVHMRASYYWKVTLGRGDSNNNRNVFTRLRSARSKVGYWNECGDTNTLIAWHAETMPSSANTFEKPSGLPSQITTETCFMVFSNSNQLNTISFCFAEAVEWHLYNDGYQNRFVSNGLNEAYITLVQNPREWKGRYVSYDRGVVFLDNSYAAFPQTPAAGVLYLGVGFPNNAIATSTRVLSKELHHSPNSTGRGSYLRSMQLEIGALTASNPTPFDIWVESSSDSSSSAVIQINLSGVGSNGASYSASYAITALRNSTRTLTRFGISKVFAMRSTSEGSVDLTDSSQITATVQKDQVVNAKNLQIVLTSPVDITNATIFIDQYIQK